MKKFLAWVLMLSMVLGLLCGCSDTDSSSDRRSKRKDRDEDKVEDRIDDDDEDRDDEDRVDEDRDDEDKVDNAKVTIEEVVVYDENDITITVTGLKDGSLGQEIKVKVENNTDKNITLSGSNYVVNGIMMDGSLYVEVAAGKKANGHISFYSESLKVAGIEQLATVDCVDAHIYDSDSYDDLYQVPFSIETSIAGDYVQKIDDSGDVIFEDSGIKVISKGVVVDERSGVTVVLLVINETGKDIVIQSENVSVNGYTISAWMYNKVTAGTVCFADMNIWNGTLEENDIETVEEISFSLTARYADEWKSFCESDELTLTVG